MTIRERIETARQRLIDAEEDRGYLADIAKDDYHTTLKNEWAGGNLIPCDEHEAAVREAVLAERERACAAVCKRCAAGDVPHWIPGANV